MDERITLVVTVNKLKEYIEKDEISKAKEFLYNMNDLLRANDEEEKENKVNIKVIKKGMYITTDKEFIEKEYNPKVKDKIDKGENPDFYRVDYSRLKNLYEVLERSIDNKHIRVRGVIGLTENVISIMDTDKVPAYDVLVDREVIVSRFTV